MTDASNGAVEARVAELRFLAVMGRRNADASVNLLDAVQHRAQAVADEQTADMLAALAAENARLRERLSNG